MSNPTQPDVPAANPAVTDADLPPVTGNFALANGPLARALHEYARVCGYDGLISLRLTEQNPQQRALIDWMSRHVAEIPRLRDMQSLASTDYRALNSFLESHGFNPLFVPFTEPDMGITSVIDASMRWGTTGTVTTIRRGNIEYPAFKLSGGYSVQTLLGSGPFTEHVILGTQNGQHVYLAMLPEDHPAPSDGAELLQLSRKMIGANSRWVNTPGGIIMPMVNFDVVDELSWLDGLKITTPHGQTYPLTQCRQHVRLSMNESGARMAAAFAGVVSRGASPQPFVINRHFVLAILDGSTPTAVFYLNPDSWSEPPADFIVAE